jgi:hypothetical protein
MDMAKEYQANESVFRKVENPKRLKVWYRFTPNNIGDRHPEFDSTYIVALQNVLEETMCNRISVHDGDLIAGKADNSSALLFTKKRDEDIVELTNYVGSMRNLLNNAESRTIPYLMEIAPNWYVFFHATLL